MHRIVIYQTGRLAEDAELLAAIAAATALDRESAAALLAAPGPAYLEDLEETAGRELLGLLEARGVDADLEPMRPAPGIAEWLGTEAPKWVKRGLVHSDSLPRIFRNYGLESPVSPSAPAARRRQAVGAGTLLRAVLTLGAVLVGLGLILFIAANWQRIPAPVKIGGSLVLTLAALHAGYWLKFGVRRRPQVAAALLLIALFGVGGVVILISQVYHVQAESYLLPLIWGALCVPLALLLRFTPGLYIASGLWLWSYWLHFQEAGQLPWIYPALLLGFLVPYALAVGDKRLHGANLGVLMLATLTTPPADGFWHCSLFVAALVVLRIRLRQGLYDWLLVAAFLIWHLAFLVRFEDLPNVLYALPLAYFFYRALESRSNVLMIANVVNTLLWLSTLLFQITERFDLGHVAASGFLMWLLGAGLLWLGFGNRLESADGWRPLSIFLRYGGAALAGLMVYILSFRFYDDQDSFYRGPLVLGSALATGAAGIALALAPAPGRPRRGSGRRGSALVLLLVAASLVLSVAAPPALLLHPLVFNLTLFAGALVMMVRGYDSQSLAWYNAGIAIFVVLIASRYLDTFVEFLPRSVFFVLGGLFLIAWAVFADRQRKRRAARALGAKDA